MAALKRNGIFFALALVMGLFGSAHAVRQPWPRRPGVVLYQLKANATATQRAAFSGTLRTAAAIAAPSATSAHGHQALTFRASTQDEEDLANQLMQTGAVAYAEPDYLMPVATLPNDPGYASQWHLPAIHAPEAWDVTTGASSIVVAVCDTGVDATHADLSARLSLPGYNTADGTTNTTPVAQHGTAVAGVIGGTGNNGVGGTGVAWAVTLLPVRVTNAADGSAWCSDMAEGIEWAADHGARVINLSYTISGCPSTIDAAASYAKTKGALTVVAAGNAGINLAGTIPTTHAYILVGASDSSGQRAFFSNYGRPVDLMAPGQSIYTTLPGSLYSYLSGTSFSSPMAAGVAALLTAMNPLWTPDEIRLLLLANGPLDAWGSVRAAQTVLAGGRWPTIPGNSDTGALAASTLDAVLVYPNPWRADRHSAEPLVFDHLTSDASLKIYTLSGHWVKTLSPVLGKANWDRKNDAGEEVASGLYLYSVTDGQGHSSQGKFSIAR